MRALSVSLLATLAVLGLSGCASTHNRMAAERAQPPLTPEQAYIAKVERVAARRGLHVIWVNPPKSGGEQLVASR